MFADPGWSDPTEPTICLEVGDLAAVIADVGLDRFVDELIDTIRTATRAFDPTKVRHQVRNGFSYDGPLGLVEWMPSMTVGEMVAVKTVGYHPTNPQATGLPSVLATTALYDTSTGRLVALCEATLLTALRTGAASAVMTDATVRPGPITLGVVGCGAQAVTQIHAISRVRPIERLIVADTSGSVAKSLASRLPPGTLGPGVDSTGVDSTAVDVTGVNSTGVEVEVLDVLEFVDVVGDLDVLCTCTSVAPDKGPVVDLRNAGPALHVNAVGSDFPGKIEIPADYLRSAVVIPDVMEQCLVEGESQQLQRDEVGPDMVAVLTDPAHQELVSQRTVFDSTGWAYEDQLAATLFLNHATRLGLGTRAALQHAPDDPYDPFEAIRQDTPQPG